MKKFLKLTVAGLCIALLAGCGSGEGSEAEMEPAVIEAQPIAEPVAQEPVAEAEPAEEVKEEEPEVIPEGCYRSELTGEWIDESLKDQRPLAVMVDNEITALPHYGTTQGDIVYEMMNSTANDRVTRLMVLIKDWGKIEQFGNVRSTRPTNIILAPEYNAILCHDGGPFHNDAYWKRSWAPDHLSGIFSRIPNGKSKEYTEYITPEDLDKYITSSDKMSATYTDYWGDHFRFASKPFTFGTPGEGGVLSAVSVDLSAAFKHNRSTLTYDPENEVYVYGEYSGSSNKYGFSGEYYDAVNNEPLTFTNVILQCCSYSQLDDHGYLIYNCMTETPTQGYYLTKGQAIPIYWTKPGEAVLTKYYNPGTGEEITLNVGKTYIGIVPDTYWNDIVIE